MAASQRAEASQFGMDQLRPLVDRFFQRLSGAQLQMIKDQIPDNATIAMLAELLIDILVYLTDSFVANVTAYRPIPKEHIVSTMGNAVPEAFAQVLGVDITDPDVSSQSLTKIMSEEVSKSVNSAITASRDAESQCMSRMTPSCRLNDMVKHARSMIQSFLCQMKSFFCLSQKSSPGDLEIVDKEDDGDHDESLTDTRKSEDSALSVQVRSQTDSRKSEDSALSVQVRSQTDSRKSEDSALSVQVRSQTDTRKSEDSALSVQVRSQTDSRKSEDSALSVQVRSLTDTRKSEDSALSVQVRSLTDSRKSEDSALSVQVRSLTDSRKSEDSSDSRKSQVQKIVSQELGDVLDTLLDDASDAERDVLLRDTLQESDSVVSDISESAGAAVGADKSLRPKITLLLAKQYAKQLIHRAARNLKKIFLPNRKVISKESLQSFADTVSELLRPEGGEKQPAGDEALQLEKLRHIAEGRDLVFTEALRSLLSDYTIEGMTPQSALRPFRNTMGNIRWSTSRAVWRFQVLLKWWMTYQTGIHCDNVMKALNATGTGAESVLRLTPDQDSETEKNKLTVRVLAEKFVTRVFKKAKVDIRCEDLCVYTDRLVSKMWAEVEGADIYISPETFKGLDKAVFKDLCKSWGCAELVLLRMNQGEQEINCIAGTFAHHLMTPPKQRSAICRFFSSLGQAISKPFTSTRVTSI
ncbi:uncharacterized protein LOC125883096 isoform X3 [Epinephelus fuscoguttatus]|uniref:uncharacterized protein LOC125883096 isoform X3 n=1 Tax=Epinephelus fuscoguttatus TaxID=293821 RepID=UPI0020D06B88|nr:uncharacterized protein LOC125883096 isoform X3 [Epinephelus fuscoguttatus]